MIARDGIADAVPPPAATPQRAPLTPLRRLRRLEEHFAHGILLFEMLETLTVTPAPADLPSTKVTLYGRGDAGKAALLKLRLPSDQDFAEELALVLGYADLRPERQEEILVQTTDLDSFFTSILPIKAGRAPMTRRLMALVADLGTFAVQRVKLAFAAPRAEMLSDQVQPMIPTPLHGSYPSGHATQAFALATFLAILTRADHTAPAPITADSQLYRMAARIAVNRTVAGVHFPVDSAAGAVLGITLARWLASRAGVAGQDCPALDFKGEQWGNTAPGHSRDFHLARLCDVIGGDDCLVVGASVQANVSDLLAALWAEAQAEWGSRWL
ncbi:phosphatase PAP2 family protein [Paracoccus shanxieyensis]|uniref:Phosphatase PAP2 family protein n=1 Tax=Paracoccus shanxieyensis TaxID=2675752 RepID=A0A6L6IUG2_9RHOB|nr:phosphatase PAP2 family protein [Paracoccus shanxieyensis]MTH63813.1 phosphatase PAP2 family protein [Paracoccus shanxieyensis]MTH86676.1 phosphatase PAP2 family protein [Paracoccus shanxieyensis]